MKTLRKISFLLEEFKLPSPGQQLLDRFLIGYPKDGAFQRLSGCEIVLLAPSTPGTGDKEALSARLRDFGLKSARNLAEAVAGSDGIVICGKGGGATANEELLEKVIAAADHGTTIFVHGLIANSVARFKELSVASERELKLAAGTSTPVTFRLPDIDLPQGSRIREALIVVQGPFPQAELDGLEGILPLLERRALGETGIKNVRYARGPGVWNSAAAQPWSKPMLAAAISRSNTIQGDPVKDGRPQDIVGLGLVEKLAPKPRAWLLEHKDGLRTGIIVLDGALEDINFAIRQNNGEIISAQLYRPPPPMQAQFNHLAASIETFFTTGNAPWPIERSLLITEIIEAFRRKS